MKLLSGTFAQKNLIYLFIIYIITAFQYFCAQTTNSYHKFITPFSTYLRKQQSYTTVQYKFARTAILYRVQYICANSNLIPPFSIFARTAILYRRSVFLREQQPYIAVQYICTNSNLISPFSIFAQHRT